MRPQRTLDDAPAEPLTARIDLNDACLFLDVDGTLLEYAATPNGVRVDPELLELMKSLTAATSGAVALVSGRPIAALDGLFAPLMLAAAGVHGFERRAANGRMHRPQNMSAQLNPARAVLRNVARQHSGVELEDKASALAMHFRGAPHAQDLVEATMARIAAELEPDFELLAGTMVLEIKPTSHSKATAVEAFLSEPPFHGRRPVYLGDDLTDVAGLDAVRRHGGLDVAVGGRVNARWSLAGPTAVRAWLRSLLALSGGSS